MSLHNSKANSAQSRQYSDKALLQSEESRTMLKLFSTAFPSLSSLNPDTIQVATVPAIDILLHEALSLLSISHSIFKLKR
jgi:hypothetical protein